MHIKTVARAKRFHIVALGRDFQLSALHKEKFKCVFLAALLLMMILLCSTASAAGVSEACLNERQENYLRVQARVSAANAKVRALVLHAQLTPYDDVDWLHEQVELINAPVIEYGASLGFEVRCTYRWYWIDGRWVAVDPLKVINVLP